MPSRRFKFEFYDSNEIKHTISLEGEVSREKISQILDYVELMGGTQSPIKPPIFHEKNSKFERIKQIIFVNFSDRVFTSKDVQYTYLDLHSESISLSTISTYLSRMVDKGLLNRGGSSGEWHYALSPKNNIT